MNESTQRLVGHGLVGLLLGFALLPFFYLWSVRSGVAGYQSPTWLTLYFLVVLVPAALVALVGWNRSRSRAETP